MSGFQHDIAGGQGNLVQQSFQSPNFIHSVQGWQVDRNGNAEFNSLTLRGTFFGTDFEINNAGAFFYSGTPAAGNLIASMAATAGTDGFGNHYLAGVASYQTTTANALQGAAFQFYTGSLSAGWTAGVSLQETAGATLNILANATSGVLIIPQPAFGNTSVTALGNTWNSTTAAECNGNFNNILGVLGEIISALDASGIL